MFHARRCRVSSCSEFESPDWKLWMCFSIRWDVKKLTEGTHLGIKNLY